MLPDAVVEQLQAMMPPDGYPVGMVLDCAIRNMDTLKVYAVVSVKVIAPAERFNADAATQDGRITDTKLHRYGHSVELLEDVRGTWLRAGQEVWACLNDLRPPGGWS